MNQDVARAVPELVAAGLLTPEQGAAALRPARGELVSLRAELRALLYLGVLAVMAGVGILLKENLDRIGPVTIAVAIAVAALGILVWVELKAAPFSWGATSSPHFAWDYFLLLAMLLLAADLAYVEAKFTPLGPNWVYHLLLVALVYGAAALRYDSRTLFSLALTTFAAWRGISVARLGAVWEQSATVVRLNALACGAAFLLLGWSLRRMQRKAHFEPVATWLGWLLILGALATGSAEDDSWPGWTLALLAVGAALAVVAVRRRRFGLFALGILAAYGALSRFVVDVAPLETLGCLWFFATSILLLVVLILTAHRFRRAA
jgi:peptidoglycan/LPS O-acetylase OafA/YrhL